MKRRALWWDKGWLEVLKLHDALSSCRFAYCGFALAQALQCLSCGETIAWLGRPAASFSHRQATTEKLSSTLFAPTAARPDRQGTKTFSTARERGRESRGHRDVSAQTILGQEHAAKWLNAITLAHPGAFLWVGTSWLFIARTCSKGQGTEFTVGLIVGCCSPPVHCNSNQALLNAGATGRGREGGRQGSGQTAGEIEREIKKQQRITWSCATCADRFRPSPWSLPPRRCGEIRSSWPSRCRSPEAWASAPPLPHSKASKERSFPRPEGGARCAPRCGSTRQHFGGVAR